MKFFFEKFNDSELVNIINNRYTSSDSIWETIKKVYEKNVQYYDCEINDKEKMPEYLRRIPKKYHKTRSNRIFRNVESVINALIANPPKPNFIPNSNSPEAIEVATIHEKFFSKKYEDRNVKEQLRKALRNLYFGRLLVVKVFWNAKINDWDTLSLDPRKVRMAPNATKEEESDFVIEDVDDKLQNVITRFPNKGDELAKLFGFRSSEDPEIMIKNTTITYQECWLNDSVVFRYQNIILGKSKNYYWDWDGLKITQEEADNITTLFGEQKSEAIRNIQESEDNEASYFFNHFDYPRKPYIFATALNNENTPIGRTDFISQAIPLQESLDRRKTQIDRNAEIANGIIKVDDKCMTKAEAQAVAYETSGVIWGKDVSTGVVRETGQALPQYIFEDMQDSRNEIDNIMAASSAFRGEREGTETKAGRLALIQQSYLALNELIQVVDYVCAEMFNWFYHLGKLRYTEKHYAKYYGQDKALEVIELTRNDLQDGADIKVIPGKTLPEDAQFKFERAQEDIKNGVISPIEYLKNAGYDDPMDTAKGNELYKLNPLKATGVSEEEMVEYAPAPQVPMEMPMEQPTV